MKVYQDLSRFKLPTGFRGRSGLVVQLWWLVQATLFQMSPQVMYSWRRGLLRLFGARVGKGVLLRPSVTVTYPWKVSLGDHCWIGDDVVLYSLAEIEIGRHAVVSQRAYLCAGSHDYLSPGFDIWAEKIIVEEQAWIAADVFVAPGVRVGVGAIVGARSSVFSDIPEGEIHVGNPAKFQRRRLPD